MLDEYKKLYKECADLIPNWNKMTKSELAQKYIECKDKNLSESYLSAIICKYWNLIGSFYSRQGIKQASDTDCYDWIIMGITKALRQKSWLKKDNKLYGDVLGPEKAMTVCIMSARANYYYGIKHQKRCLNYSSYSIEALEESFSDGYLLQYFDNYTEIENDKQKNLVKSLMADFDFYVAITVDLVYNSNKYINVQNLRRQILKLDKSYIKYFTRYYEVDEFLIKNIIFELKQLTNRNLHGILIKAKQKIISLM